MVATGVVDTSSGVSSEVSKGQPHNLPTEHRFKSTMKVADLLRDRPAVVHSIAEDATVLEAVKVRFVSDFHLFHLFYF
jgi:hypothetical protein